jgi:hypothetical protein
MPVLVVAEVPGGSSELDLALIEAWKRGSDPPTGNRLRMAGPMDGGWRIVSLWDSREQFEQFAVERLHLTLQGAGSGEPQVTFWDIETVHSYG